MLEARRGDRRTGSPTNFVGETAMTRPFQAAATDARIAARAASPPLTEQQIQSAVFEHLRVRGAPGIFAWHPFSGGYRKPVEAAIYKSLGARAGLPDVMVLHNGRLFCVELKREGGRATEKQLETIAAMEAAGALTCIAEGLNQAIAVLEAWKILVGKSQSSIAQKHNADKCKFRPLLRGHVS